MFNAAIFAYVFTVSVFCWIEPSFYSFPVRARSRYSYSKWQKSLAKEVSVQSIRIFSDSEVIYMLLNSVYVHMFVMQQCTCSKLPHVFYSSQNLKLDVIDKSIEQFPE